MRYKNKDAIYLLGNLIIAFNLENKAIPVKIFLKYPYSLKAIYHYTVEVENKNRVI